jgi:uncharacterized protein with PQ loop repeat
MTWKVWNTMTGYDKYMLFVGLVGQLFLVLQIATMIKNKSSENVSFSSYLILSITTLSWLVFALLNKDTIITVSSMFALVGSLTALNIVVIYKKSKSNLL